MGAHASTASFVLFKLGVLLTTLFLFFITTTLVSFTLRETQERMLKFTFLLQHHVRHRMSYISLIVTHLVESLVYVGWWWLGEGLIHLASRHSAVNNHYTSKAAHSSRAETAANLPPPCPPPQPPPP